jgi:DNA mismatch repair ATPase MutS
VSWKALVPILILNGLITTFFAQNVNRLHAAIGKTSTRLQAYSNCLKWIEGGDFKSEYLNDLKQKCRQSPNNKRASEQVKELAALANSLDYRLNLIVGAILNGGFLWDIRCSHRIDRWHRTFSDNVVAGLNVIGEFEAIISLSTLHFNYPTWEFPEIQEEYKLNAEELGHPLITPETRVTNDFAFAQNKTIDVITGSNMAGKSTFLRTLGVNLVLAYSGAPACCKKMHVSLFKLISYMRIKDSLNESTSTFKAEINRLKMILETTAEEENSLALIDEMLRGTNSRDKYLGTKVFIERLIQQQSSAIIATHDLHIAELAQAYAHQIRNFNFDIQTDGVEMFFDYKLKTGECKTFIASILLKQIGLEIGKDSTHS